MSASKQTAEPAGNKRAQLDKEKFTETKGGNLFPTVRLLKLERAVHSQLNKKVFGSPSTKTSHNKTIMVVGATGSGKTTLINGMINYVLGVEWEDSWRYKLIDEPVKTQAHSQTSEVTAYQIYHTDGFQVPYSLTIIDTPGFGDTRGIKQDIEITEKIRQFFSGKGAIDQIDAVCFVVQSSFARLTHTQKYVFESILSIFGKDIKDNILLLVTFADGQPPPVLEAIKEANIPCASNPDGSSLHFKFNNSVLFAKNTGDRSDEDNFDSMFWKMGKASMKTFFTKLNLIEPRSLTLTKQVLKERRQLETTAEGLQSKIQVRLSKLEEIKSTRHALQNHKAHMDENKDFAYEVVVPTFEKITNEPGRYVTNCLLCNRTCHLHCAYSNNDDKIKCSAMQDGKCTNCPNKCHWKQHVNMEYRLEVKNVKEKRTYEVLKSKYEAALKKKMTAVEIITQLEVEYEQMQVKVVETMTTLTQCLERLTDIALRPDPLSTVDYIDILIESEKQEAKDGFQKRMKELQEVRARAVLLKNAADGVIITEQEQSTLGKMMSKVKGLFTNS